MARYNEIPRSKLIDILETIRTCHCAYSLPPGIKGGPSMHGAKVCDCKYGGQKIRQGVSGEEGNGCPELRDVIGLLVNTTDYEYKQMFNRAARRAMTQARKRPKVKKKR